jgi:hypothetical protein
MPYSRKNALFLARSNLLLKSINILAATSLFCLCAGCASIQANKDLNTTPENLLRGDPANSIKTKEYLQHILDSPEGYEVKAYNRKPYSVNNRKTLFMNHSFYVFFKDGSMEHTLVFTATPQNSERNGCWMLDATTDLESYDLFISGDNSWEMEEYQGSHGETRLDTVQTARKIMNRLDKGYTFFGGAIVRDLPWYHQVWMFLVPPPILTYLPVLLMSIHADNCTTATLDTMVWEQP